MARGDRGRCGPAASAGPAGEGRPEARGSLEHDLALREGSAEPAGRASWPRADAHADAPCFPHTQARCRPTGPRSARPCASRRSLAASQEGGAASTPPPGMDAAVHSVCRFDKSGLSSALIDMGARKHARRCFARRALAAFFLSPSINSTSRVFSRLIDETSRAKWALQSRRDRIRTRSVGAPRQCQQGRERNGPAPKARADIPCA